MNHDIETAIQLKQDLVDFVYDAEGELATALETYALEKGKKNSYGIKQQNLTIDLFLSDGKVQKQTPVDIYLATATDLGVEDREIIQKWQDNFIGLFEITAIENEYYYLMNWLTAKTYKVGKHSQISDKEIKRWQPGEIILTIIAPINNEWFFFSDRIIKGKLSKPKLAVAIGEFRDHYPDFLYADAPELLELAWDSVAVYHQEFVDYFGSDKITLPGYKLNQKIGELQQIMSKNKLAEAGIDADQSLTEVLTASGSNETEFSEVAQDLGIDEQATKKILANQDRLGMVTPKVDLPPEIRQAEQVTVYSHPRWGQMFLPNFNRLLDLLSNSNSKDLEAGESSQNNLLIGKYLKLPEANYYIWQQLKQQYSQKLETILQDYLDKDNFNLDQDLDSLLLEYNKNSTPELPAIASVPIHLNNLFEEALAQVQKTRAKTKKKRKKGFLS